MEHLFVSDVTADGFRLSWAADGDLFDRYVIRIRDAKRAARPREYAAGGAERTKVLTGLASGTEYEIELYGVSLDQRSQPVSGVAQTGTCSRVKGQRGKVSRELTNPPHPSASGLARPVRASEGLVSSGYFRTYFPHFNSPFFSFPGACSFAPQP